MSPKLWLSARFFPLSPVTDKLHVVFSPLDYFLFISLLLLLVLIAIAKRPFIYLAIFLLLAVFLSLQDQTRWQPWFYQYVFMLGAFFVYYWKAADERKEVLLNTCRMITASTYFWSGLQKLNISFIDRVLPSLINPYLNHFFGPINPIPRPLIVCVPLFEIFIGIGLLTRKFRNAAVVLAVMTHIVLLLLLIPVRLNSVVWPWNIAMAALVVILFWRADDVSLREVVLPRKLSFQMVAILLFGIMPLLSFFGLWDSYLSDALYSGNVANALIHVSESTKERLPVAIRDQVQENPVDGQLVINPYRWSLGELNAPGYPERRVFLNLTKQICAYATDPSEVNVVIYGKPSLLRGLREVHTYTCSDL